MNKLQFTASLLLSLALVSCQSPIPANSDPESTNAQATAGETESKETSAETTLSFDEHYSVYDSALYNEFDEAMNNNPIDAEYAKNLAGASTAQDMSSLAKSLNESWKTELDFACNNLKQYLTDEDAQLFDTAQQKWEDGVEQAYEFDEEFLRDPSKYGVSAGSSFSSAWLSEITDEYRSRAVHVKYLTYIYESQNSSDAPTWKCWAADGQ